MDELDMETKRAEIALKQKQKNVGEIIEDNKDFTGCGGKPKNKQTTPALIFSRVRK